MNKLASIAAALVTVCSIGAASAAGIPTLKTVAGKQIVTQKLPGQDLRVRAPKNASLKMYSNAGMMEGFTAVKATEQTKTGKIYTLAPGRYQYGAKNFVVRALVAYTTRAAQ